MGHYDVFEGSRSELAAHDAAGLWYNVYPGFGFEPVH